MSDLPCVHDPHCPKVISLSSYPSCLRCWSRYLIEFCPWELTALAFGRYVFVYHPLSELLVFFFTIQFQSGFYSEASWSSGLLFFDSFSPKFRTCLSWCDSQADSWNDHACFLYEFFLIFKLIHKQHQKISLTWFGTRKITSLQMLCYFWMENDPISIFYLRKPFLFLLTFPPLLHSHTSFE